MKISIQIDTAYAAFSDNPYEMQEILKQAENWYGESQSGIRRGDSRKLVDSNGNTVGSVRAY